MNYIFLYLSLLFLTFLFTVAIIKMLVPKLSKIAKQPIYEEGPKWHIKKSGTPTMGGIGFIIPMCIAFIVSVIFLFNSSENLDGISILITLGFSVLNALVGVVDDITKLKRAKNGGLTPKQKLLLQFVISILFLIARKVLLMDSSKIFLGRVSINLGWLYYPLAILFLLGMINCANLTDGIDGLAASVAFAIGVCSFLFSFHQNVSSWIVSITLVGATLGFLLFNIHPAKIFMGDTGSLFLGAIISSLAFSMNSLPAYLLIGGIYVIEGISVILQVVYFKKTKKRLFKMAPLHHHLEKSGFDESKICIYAMLFTFIMSLIAFPLIGN